MIAVLKIVRAYFLILATASILILPFIEGMPGTYALGFSIFALPTVPIVKLMYPIFEGLFSTDYVILPLIFAVSLAYAALSHLIIVFLDKRGHRETSSEKPSEKSSII